MLFSNDIETSTIFGSSYGNSFKDGDNCLSCVILGTNFIARVINLPLSVLAIEFRTLDVCESGMEYFPTFFFIIDLKHLPPQVASPLYFVSFLFENVEFKASNNNLITYLSNIKSLYNYIVQTLKLIIFIVYHDRTTCLPTQNSICYNTNHQSSTL